MISALVSVVLSQTGSAQEPVRFPDLSVSAAAGVSGKPVGPLAKLSHDLIDLDRALQAPGPAPGPPPHVRVRGGLVVIDAAASGDADLLLADLEALGLENGAAFGRLVSGWLPVRALRDAAALSTLRLARPAAATTSVGSVTSQGDPAMRSDVARITFSVDGADTTVGALSDSYDCLGGEAADITSGDIPSGVVVLQEEVGCGSGTDEGRAMLQLVHDVAPGASLAFHSAFNGQADFAEGIIELAAAGADSIVDDIIYFAEPMFQDGGIAQAVDTVVAGGASYFSSAGNAGRIAYEAQFDPGGLISVGTDEYTVHDFDPGPEVDVFQQFTLPQGARVIFVLQWDEPFFSVSGSPGSANDMDIFIVNAAETQVRAGSTDANLGGDPVELFAFTNSPGGGPPSTTFNVMLGKLNSAEGPNPGTLKYVVFGGVGASGPIMTIDQFDTASGTVYGHTNAAGTEAVGAAWYEETPEFGTSPPLLEPFSSAGPTPILFDTSGAAITPEVRQKPEIVAPDGTDTTFFGTDTDSNGFPNFFGTSASAPHAAAVAALLLEADPSMSPAQVYATLESTAIDMGAPGIDFDSGAGLIQADAALALVAPLAVGDTYVVQTGSTRTIDVTAGVLANDFDPQGDLLTAVLVADAASGTLDLQPDGSFTYRTGPTFAGFDSFTYLATDGTSTSDVATVDLIDAFSFVDVLSDVGLASPLFGTYVHSASWGDFNHDGWQDLYIGTFVEPPTPTPNRLFVNNNGVFEDAGQAAVEVSGRATNSVFADFDNDGDLDLYLSNNRKVGGTGPVGEPSHLFRNDAGVFVDVTSGSGIDAQSSNGREVGVLDYNNDGLLDLFIVADQFAGGGPTTLLKNLGNFQFEDATVAAGIPTNIHGLGLAIGDVTGNGWPDIFVAGDQDQLTANKNFLLVANADGTYHTLATNTFDWTSFMLGNEDWVSGAAMGDLNRDGMLDILVGHHFGTSAESGVGPPIRVYMNRGLDGSSDPIFEDITEALGLPNTVDKAPHVEIQDFDNDGWPDLYTSVRIDTASGISPMIFRHTGLASPDPTFSAPIIEGAHYYPGGPVADFDRDGQLDMFLSEFRSVLDQGVVPSLLMRNVGVSGNWLDVRVSAGDNRFGIGAKVRIYKEGMNGDPAGLIGFAEIATGFGFSSSGPPLAHFGLGSETAVDVEIELPFGGGTTSRLSVAANTSLVVASVGLQLLTDGSIPLGVIQLGATVDTTEGGLNDKQTVEVTAGPVDLFIRTNAFTDETNTWTLGASLGGLDVAVWEFSPDGTTWTPFTVADTLFPLSTASLAIGETQDVYFRLSVPTESSSSFLYSAVVTIVSVAPP